jgi:hypothetical protein
VTDTTSIAETSAAGATVPAQTVATDAPDRRPWRPEDDVTDSLYALGELVDGTDPDFDEIAGISATRLLMAASELGVIWSRRARRTGIPVTVGFDAERFAAGAVELHQRDCQHCAVSS